MNRVDRTHYISVVKVVEVSYEIFLPELKDFEFWNMRTNSESVLNEHVLIKRFIRRVNLLETPKETSPAAGSKLRVLFLS